MTIYALEEFYMDDQTMQLGLGILQWITSEGDWINEVALRRMNDWASAIVLITRLV